MNEFEKVDFIRDNVSETSRLVQLGEECAELSQAIFKYIRKRSNDNPTPKTMEEIKANIQEEMVDVQLVLDTFPVTHEDNMLIFDKLDRWVARLKEAKSSDS